MNLIKNRKYDFSEKRLDLDIDEENEYPEQPEYYYDEDEDYEYDQNYDFSIPKSSCDQYGNGYLFLLSKKSVYFLRNPDLVDDMFFFYRNSYDFDKTLMFSIVEEFNIHIDFKNIIINDIKDLSSSFDLNNLSHINLSIYLDKQFKSDAIKFVQSVIRLQSLKECIIKIVPKYEVYKYKQKKYLQKMIKYLKFNSNINYSKIYLYDSKNNKYETFEIIQDLGKIKKLFMSQFVQIELDQKESERFEVLQIKEPIDQSFFTCVNQFLKKMINLTYLKIDLYRYYRDYSSYEEENLQQYEILQTISELKQLKKLELKCNKFIHIGKELKLESKNMESLIICQENTKIQIRCENLVYLDVKLIQIAREMSSELYQYLVDQIFVTNNLKVLKMHIHQQKNMYEEGQNQVSLKKGREQKRKLNAAIKRYCKKLVLLDIVVKIC